jgi:hypothetical protein
LNTCASRLSWPSATGAKRPARLASTTSTLRLAARSLWIETMVSTSFSTSTRSALCRASSASRRLALEMSEISRSRRLTSCWMMALSRSRSSARLARGSVSTAERSEVSGFFSSCATSAAKRSIASMRL